MGELFDGGPGVLPLALGKRPLRRWRWDQLAAVAARSGQRPRLPPQSLRDSHARGQSDLWLWSRSHLRGPRLLALAAHGSPVRSLRAAADPIGIFHVSPIVAEQEIVIPGLTAPLWEGALEVRRDSSDGPLVGRMYMEEQFGVNDPE